MKKYTYIALALFCILLTGCGTIAKHSQEREERPHIYGATRFDCYFLYACLSPFRKKHGTLDVSEFAFLMPFAIIDIPIAIMFDTVELPLDVYDLHKAVTIDNAWDVAFKTGIISDKINKQPLALHTRDKIRYLITSSSKPIGTNVLNHLIPIAIMHSTEGILYALSDLSNLSPEQYWSIYIWQKNRPFMGGTMEGKLLKNKSIPLNILIDMTSSKNEYTVMRAISSGMVPSQIVTNKLEMLSHSENSRCRDFVRSYYVKHPNIAGSTLETTINSGHDKTNLANKVVGEH